MIQFDRKNKQILTSLCQRCPDEYFQPQYNYLPHVGCCSYSPVFTLFEIKKMIDNNKMDFFMNTILHNTNKTIKPYEIIIHANIHKSFHEDEHLNLTKMDLTDVQQKYSVCQFFEDNKGCSLEPFMKTSICRSFICTTVEEKLNRDQQIQFQNFVKDIQKEVENFNRQHQDQLAIMGLDLIDDVQEVLEYLKKLN